MLRRFKDASLQHKQTTVIMSTCVLALLLAGAAFVTIEVITFRKELVRNVGSLATMIAHASSTAVQFSDRKGAEEPLKALRADPNIVYAAIYLPDGTVFAEYRPPHLPPSFTPPAMPSLGHTFHGEHLLLCRDITHRGEHIGMVLVKSDLKLLSAQLERFAGVAVLVFAIVSLVALLLSLRLQRLVSAPILRLAQTARSVAALNDYGVRVQKQSADEIGQLIESFNGMLQQIQNRDKALQRAHVD